MRLNILNLILKLLIKIFNILILSLGYLKKIINFLNLIIKKSKKGAIDEKRSPKQMSCMFIKDDRN